MAIPTDDTCLTAYLAMSHLALILELPSLIVHTIHSYKQNSLPDTNTASLWLTDLDHECGQSFSYLCARIEKFRSLYNGVYAIQSMNYSHKDSYVPNACDMISTSEFLATPPNAAGALSDPITQPHSCTAHMLNPAVAHPGMPRCSPLAPVRPGAVAGSLLGCKFADIQLGLASAK
jgi:hypothetical protein